jgi:NADH:ubiquinone oxidoreductase subunit K
VTLIILSCGFFGIGLFGVLARRDTIALLASVEVMLGGPLLLLVGLGTAARNEPGALAMVQAVHIEGIALVLLVVAAAEAAVGLALLVAVARKTRSVSLEELREVKG